MPDTVPDAAPAVPGWPAAVDPEANYAVRLAEPVLFGPTVLTPRHAVTVTGRVLLTIQDKVARVGPA